MNLPALWTSPALRTHGLRVGLTLLLAYAAARLCVWLDTPIPWMIGPLVATALASILGAPTASHHRLRNLGQWTIGAALGLYFTPQVGQLIAGLWWAVLLGIAWALALGWGFGTWLYRLHAPRMTDTPVATLRSTTYFASAIGGASEMTLLAERAGARTDLVAAAHSMRLLVVTLSIPFAMQLWGVSRLDTVVLVTTEVDLSGLLLLAALTGLGGWVVHRLGRANPWFMGALLMAMGLTLTGWTLSAIPGWMSNAAQLLIGVSLGVRFRAEFVHTAPRWLASVALATVVMMILCAAFAWTLAALTGLHPATLVLGTSPGGIAEMAITAKVLHLGVPVVTAFHATRLLAVLVLVEPVYRLFLGRPP